MALVRPRVVGKCQRRLLSSSRALQAVGPESPRWIDVPKVVQPPTTPRVRVKGILPVPRQVINPRREHKGSNEYIMAATREPESRRQDFRDDESGRRLAWKQRMSDSRRQSLRDGLAELMESYTTNRAITKEKKQKGDRRTRAARTAPEAKYERLTRPNYPVSIQKALERKPSEPAVPRRPENVEAHVARMKNLRMGHIHNLYLHAKDFILDEKDLEQELEKQFGRDNAPATWGGAVNVWAVGKPQGTRELMTNVQESTSLPTLSAADTTDKRKERMMRISAELLGGRLSIKPIPDVGKRHDDFGR
jgi:hypothetical protein